MNISLISPLKYCKFGENAYICRKKLVVAIFANKQLISQLLKIKNKMAKAKPFIKWVGGKSQLIEQLEALLPADFSERENVRYN